MSSRGMVLITGGATGIGFACADALLGAGFGVAIMGRRTAVVEAAVEELQRAHPDSIVAGYPGDVSVRQQVNEIVEEVIAGYGRIFAFVSSAAVCLPTSISELSGNDWDATFDIGVRGSAFCSAALARHMIAEGGGRIVLVSSNVSLAVDAGVHAYCADKAAVNSLARSLAVELAPHGIGANAVAPGWVGTTMTEKFVPEDPALLLRINPLGRIGLPEEIANVVRYLVADAPAFLTGSVIVVDGGATARAPFV